MRSPPGLDGVRVRRGVFVSLLLAGALVRATVGHADPDASADAGSARLDASAPSDASLRPDTAASSDAPADATVSPDASTRADDVPPALALATDATPTEDTPAALAPSALTAPPAAPARRALPPVDTEVAPPPHREPLQPLTGIFVFTNNVSPGVQVGNKVDVQGIYKEYFTQAEIDTPFVKVTDPGTTLPFMPISIANAGSIATGGAQAEAYESMLVQIGAVTISNINPDGAQDFDEFAVSPGNLRIDDQVFGALDNLCPVNTAFTGFTGVVAFSFSNSKLLPRSAADIGLVGAADPGYCKPFP